MKGAGAGLKGEEDNEKTSVEETPDERVPFDRDELRRIEEEGGGQSCSSPCSTLALSSW
jgi:hypothetical protein